MGSFGSYTTQDFAREASAQERFYEEQERRFDEAFADNAAKMEDLRRRRSDALQAFARTACREFTPEALGELSLRAALPSVESLARERGVEETALRKTLARIEADDRFQKRDALLAPQTGVLPAQIAEIEPLLRQAREFIARLEAFEGFRELYSRNYGLRGYPHQGFLRFLSPEYHTDTSNAERVMAEMGARDFAEVRGQYDSALEQTLSFGATLADLRRQVSDIQRLADDHTQALRQIESLPALYWERVGSSLYRHLQDGGATALQRFVGEEKELEDRYKRLDGLEHQIEYLQALAAKITQDRSALAQKSAALRDETLRYNTNPHRFRNKRWTEEQFRKKFNRDAGRYDRSLHRYNRASTTVYVFEDYGRVSLWEEFLWWDVMTDGRLDGNFIPEAQEFYNAHPDYSYDRSAFANENASDFADNS